MCFLDHQQRGKYTTSEPRTCSESWKRMIYQLKTSRLCWKRRIFTEQHAGKLPSPTAASQRKRNSCSKLTLLVSACVCRSLPFAWLSLSHFIATTDACCEAPWWPITWIWKCDSLNEFEIIFTRFKLYINANRKDFHFFGHAFLLRRGLTSSSFVNRLNDRIYCFLSEWAPSFFPARTSKCD